MQITGRPARVTGREHLTRLVLLGGTVKGSTRAESASAMVAFPTMALDRTGTSRIEGFDRAVPVWLIAAGALLLLIFLPLGWLAYTSVSGERGLTLAHYQHVFTDPRLGR